MLAAAIVFAITAVALLAARRLQLGSIVALITCFRPTAAPWTAPVYAAVAPSTATDVNTTNSSDFRQGPSAGTYFTTVDIRPVEPVSVIPRCLIGRRLEADERAKLALTVAAASAIWG